MFSETILIIKLSHQLKRPRLGLKRAFLLHGVNDGAVQEYYARMINTSRNFGAPPDRAKTELRDTLEFEIKLANVREIHFILQYEYSLKCVRLIVDINSRGKSP